MVKPTKPPVPAFPAAAPTRSRAALARSQAVAEAALTHAHAIAAEMAGTVALVPPAPKANGHTLDIQTVEYRTKVVRQQLLTDIDLMSTMLRHIAGAISIRDLPPPVTSFVEVATRIAVNRAILAEFGKL